MLFSRIHLASVAVTVILGGCATVLPGGTPEPPRKVTPDTSGQFDPIGSYTLSDEELKLDCKKLTGRMQVRILQIRNPSARPEPSVFSQSAQVAVQPIFGGPSTNASPREQMARDRAVLDAYNKRLAAKGCPTFDVYKELQESDVKHSPRPLPKEPPAKKN